MKQAGARSAVKWQVGGDGGSTRCWLPPHYLRARRPFRFPPAFLG